MCPILLPLRLTSDGPFDKCIRWTEHRLYLWKSEPMCSLKSQGWEWTEEQTSQIQGSSCGLLYKDAQHSCRETTTEILHIKFLANWQYGRKTSFKRWHFSPLLSVTCICWHEGTEQSSPQLLCHLFPHLLPHCCPPPAAAPSLLHLWAPAQSWQWQAAQAPWRPTAQMLQSLPLPGGRRKPISVTKAYHNLTIFCNVLLVCQFF